MLTGKHVPSSLLRKGRHPSDRNRHLGDENLSMMSSDNVPEGDHPSTMVPPAFNPVFWLLQSAGAGGSGTSDHQQQGGQMEENAAAQQRFGFPPRQQHHMPEIEMRLGPFAPSSSRPHEFGGGFHGGNANFMQQDRGDLSSITANLHNGGAQPGTDSMDYHQSSSRALVHWEGGHHHNGSEPSSSSTSNNTEMAQFHESGSHLWVNPDASSAIPREERYAEPSPEHEGSDTVMKWCDMLPTQEQSPTPSASVRSGLQHQQQMQSPLGWQMQVEGGGQDQHHSMYAEPGISQELQRMAAVLDQI